MDLKSYIRTIPNFPKPGVMFRDMMPLLASGKAFQELIDVVATHYQHSNIDKVVAIESRGFIIGAPLALALHAGFVPARKPGKLPGNTIEQTYTLEYGENCLEMSEDAIKPNEKVLLIDDLLATGGTAEAAAHLIRRLGGDIIECVFMIELLGLNGQQRLLNLGLKVYTLCDF